MGGEALREAEGSTRRSDGSWVLLGPARPHVPLLPILSVNFIGSLGFSLVLPFLIFLVTRWGGNALIYGIMGATYSAFQLIGAPLMGRWSDTYGRKKVLLLSQLGTLASWIIFLIAFALPQGSLLAVDSSWLGSFTLTLPLVAVFLARAADGLTGGNISVANAYIADISGEKERSVNFGKMAVATNLGFILGPAIAGLLGASPWRELLPVLAAIAVSIVASLVIALKLPESMCGVLDRDPSSRSVRKVFGQEHKECFRLQAADQLSFAQILRLRCVPTLLAIYFLAMLAFNFFYVTFPVYVVQTLGWQVTDTGIFFAMMGLLLVIVQGPLLSRLSRRLSDPVMLIGGALVEAVGFVLFDSARTEVIYLGLGLLSLGNGIMWPSVLALMSKAAGERHQGAVQGVAGSVGAVASIAGLLLAGLAYGTLEGRLFWLSGGAILAVFLLAAFSFGAFRRTAAVAA